MENVNGTLSEIGGIAIMVVPVVVVIWYTFAARSFALTLRNILIGLVALVCLWGFNSLTSSKK